MRTHLLCWTLTVAWTVLIFFKPGFCQQSGAEPVSPPAAQQVPAPAATAPSAPEATVPAPPEKAEIGLLVCYREKRILGAALNTSVHVDDVEIADLDNGCYVVVKVKPGEHSLYADEKDDAFTVKVEAGKTYFFRMELTWGLWKGHGRLKEVDAETGDKEFKEWNPELASDIRQPEMVVKKY
jgi:hypothetical protein